MPRDGINSKDIRDAGRGVAEGKKYGTKEYNLPRAHKRLELAVKAQSALCRGYVAGGMEQERRTENSILCSMADSGEDDSELVPNPVDGFFPLAAHLRLKQTGNR